jgi:hypothetical protein
MTKQARTSDVLAHPTLAAALADIPEVADLLGMMGDEFGLPIGSVLDILGLSSDPRGRDFLALLETVPTDDRDYPPATAPRDDLEDETIQLGSARIELPEVGRVGRPLEIILHGPDTPNGFVDVEITAEVTVEGADAPVHVGGFYDGDDRYIIRFLPDMSGTHRFTTSSTTRSLHHVTFAIAVEPGRDAPGPVRVAGTGFIRANGAAFVPFGTTAYAWTHQEERLQRETLASLARAPFNKLRMCLFPKHYVFNTNEPERFPFVRDGDGFDWSRLDVEYFRHLEERLRDLAALGIEADLILFHPYDRWGFADMGPAVDERYVRYVVRRLAAFPNVWWSLANEYDLVVSTKSDADWDRLGTVVQLEDHVGHPRSIHNGARFYDNGAEWVTHASLQCGSTQNISRWLADWRKPVVVDETGYEGDLEFEWGNLTAVELVRKFWEAVLRGAAMTHGETYWNDAEEIFWAKGGRLIGESVARIAFLRDVVEQSPTGRMEPLGELFGRIVAGVKDTYEVHFLGLQQGRSATVKVRPGQRAMVDVLDAWEMTVDTLEGPHSGSVQVPLPGRPMQAVRLRYLDEPVSTHDDWEGQR